MNNLALAVIAKSNYEDIERIVNDYGQYFNEIVVAYDQYDDRFGNLENAKTRFVEYTWGEEEKEIGYPKFDKKRNFLAENIVSDYYFRLDTDDKITNPENIVKCFERAVSNNIDIVYFNYRYAFDKYGECIAEHWRETIIRKKDGLKWNKEIHENILVDCPSECRGMYEKSMEIVHDKTAEEAEASEERNFKFLIKEFERDGEKTDPRTVAYIGRMLLGKGLYERAIPFMHLLIEKSGWDDDKYFAYIQLAEAYLRVGNTDDAIACANEALVINEKHPDAYLMLGLVFMDRKEYDKALNWFLIGDQKKRPLTNIVLNPSIYTTIKNMNIAMCYLARGEYKKGYEYYNKAKESAPDNKDVLRREKLFVEAIENDEYLKNLAWTLKYNEKYDPTNCKRIVEAIPNKLMTNDVVHRMKNKYTPGRQWADNEICIFCGGAWEEWAPPSVINGIGGSEEAVIYVSQELTKLGYKVTVYNQCGEMRGEYAGVVYKCASELNIKDKFNIFISWRGTVFTSDVKAKNRIVWLHDVPQNGQFNSENLQYIDKIMVLSNYHRSLLPSIVPEEKIFVSANGINMADFSKDLPVERNQKRMIYTSSYDRGIEHLLEMWPDIKKEVPEAELHLFYGWNTYDEMIAKGYRSKDWKDAMVKLMNQDGIIEHGRVGHKKLVEEFQKSGVWVYPSHFEEISCISAMKAQACGCVPVYVNYAALKETVKDGVKINGKAGDGHTNEEFKRELINVLNKPALQEVYRNRVYTHKGKFGWDVVAKQWSEKLFNNQEVLV